MNVERGPGLDEGLACVLDGLIILLINRKQSLRLLTGVQGADHSGYSRSPRVCVSVCVCAGGLYSTSN
jgi:hypothetical protein